MTKPKKPRIARCLPCACGSRVRISVTADGDWKVWCAKCWIESIHAAQTRDAAIASWNSTHASVKPARKVKR
jgi:hypothetical protein